MINKIRHIFLLILLSLFSWFTVSAQYGAAAFIEQDTIVIGDQVFVSLELKLDQPSSHVIFPIIPDTFSKIEVISKGKIDTIFKDGATIYSQKIIVTSFDEGNYEIPQFVFSYKDTNGVSNTVSTQALSLRVNTINVDESKPFKDIHDIMEEGGKDKEIQSFLNKLLDFIDTIGKLFWVGLAIVILLIAFLVYYLFFRKKKKQFIVETPHGKALRLLNELEKSEKWSKGEYKTYYSELSDIVRTYLQQSTEYAAVEMTTRDLLIAVKRNSDLRKIHQELKSVLQNSDLVKFAKVIPDEENRDEVIKNAKKIIEKTIPIIEEEEGNKSV